ncbi:hypothetical protein, partial [Rickettsia sp. wb]
SFPVIAQYLIYTSLNLTVPLKVLTLSPEHGYNLPDLDMIEENHLKADLNLLPLGFRHPRTAFSCSKMILGKTLNKSI